MEKWATVPFIDANDGAVFFPLTSRMGSLFLPLTPMMGELLLPLTPRMGHYSSH
ncbi:unnamed protein product [Staurois parvus]|uniref:Uncharacterized protein n=1 Tax=Staurois parvus TaxID=386267 RepID=A0ABN9H129_9NEOB|nr:unnamed protein product [Staurois parvus]